MSFATGTPINISSTAQQAIETITAGDTVYAADYANPAQWSEQAIHEAAPRNFQPGIMTIRYQLATGPIDITVTNNQPFLLSTKATKQAYQLTKHDYLLTPTGESVAILEVLDDTVGYTHDIIVSTTGANWIVAGGVVCGDAVIQRALLP